MYYLECARQCVGRSQRISFRSTPEIVDHLRWALHIQDFSRGGWEKVVVDGIPEPIVLGVQPVS